MGDMADIRWFLKLVVWMLATVEAPHGCSIVGRAVCAYTFASIGPGSINHPVGNQPQRVLIVAVETMRVTYRSVKDLDREFILHGDLANPH